MKKLLFALLFVLFCFGCKSGVYSKSKSNSDSQSIVFESEELTDCNEVIFNPDMGFYTTITIPVTESGISEKSKIVTEIKNGFDGLICHLGTAKE